MLCTVSSLLLILFLHFLLLVFCFSCVSQCGLTSGSCLCCSILRPTEYPSPIESIRTISLLYWTDMRVERSVKCEDTHTRYLQAQDLVAAITGEDDILPTSNPTDCPTLNSSRYAMYISYRHSSCIRYT